MSSEDFFQAFCSCLSDARELWKRNSVFEGSTLVSASFCRVRSLCLLRRVLVKSCPVARRTAARAGHHSNNTALLS